MLGSLPVGHRLDISRFHPVTTVDALLRRRVVPQRALVVLGASGAFPRRAGSWRVATACAVGSVAIGGTRAQ